MNVKNYFFALLFVLTSAFSFAHEAPADFEGVISVQTQSVNPAGKSAVVLSFDSKQDFEAFDLQQLDQLVEAGCTADLTVKISVGFGATYIEVEATLKDIPCEEIVKKAKELKENLEKELDEETLED